MQPLTCPYVYGVNRRSENIVINKVAFKFKFKYMALPTMISFIFMICLDNCRKSHMFKCVRKEKGNVSFTRPNKKLFDRKQTDNNHFVG